MDSCAVECQVKFAEPNSWQMGVVSTWDLLDGNNEIPIDEFRKATELSAIQCPGVAYEINTSGDFAPPGGVGNYILTLDDVVMYIGFTSDITKRIATSKTILFASLRPHFAMLWVPGGTRETEHILRKYLYPEWNSTELRKLRPFHDCGFTLGRGWPRCELRYYSAIYKDKRSLFSLASA